MKTFFLNKNYCYYYYMFFQYYYYIFLLLRNCWHFCWELFFNIQELKWTRHKTLKWIKITRSVENTLSYIHWNLWNTEKRESFLTKEMKNIWNFLLFFITVNNRFSDEKNYSDNNFHPIINEREKDHRIYSTNTLSPGHSRRGGVADIAQHIIINRFYRQINNQNITELTTNWQSLQSRRHRLWRESYRKNTAECLTRVRDGCPLSADITKHIKLPCTICFLGKRDKR